MYGCFKCQLKKKNPLKLCKASTDSKDITNITNLIISFLTQKIKKKG
nr:MAG TPA: hypothetical protein [Caudoviricetes sp.]